MRKEGIIWKTFKCVVIILGLILILGPVFVIFINTMKTMQEAGRDFFALPSSFNFDNYKELFSRSDFWSSFRNSLIVTVTSVSLIVIVIPALSHAVARNLNKKYYKLLYYYILAGIFIPFQVLMLPMVKQMTQIKLLNQFGLILLHLTFSLPTGLFLFVNYIRSLPAEVEEAARVDGCNVFQTYVRIVIHLIKPMIATIIVMDSLGCWNNFMMALLILNKNHSMWTLPLMQYNFKAEYSFNYTMAFTAYIVCMIPIVIVYALGQKYIIKGLTAGAVKS
ncbi:MAG: carbohydrate ABC transporter permease [Eisenbergiella massiliensis]